MRNPIFIRPSLASQRPRFSDGFTLMETVIAIGVLAVLLTGFVAVFTPAAQGIRRSISAQQADRLATTLERELVTLRQGQNNNGATVGFDKAFNWIQEGGEAATAIFVYQYRGDASLIRKDGSPEPLEKAEGQPGKDYVIQSIARRANDPLFDEDLKALDGALFYTKPTQLINQNNEMALGSIGKISDPQSGGIQITAADQYNGAVIAFSAEFFDVPSKSINYISGPEFKKRFDDTTRPVFSRNLTVRR